MVSSPSHNQREPMLDMTVLERLDGQSGVRIIVLHEEDFHRPPYGVMNHGNTLARCAKVVLSPMP